MWRIYRKTPCIFKIQNLLANVTIEDRNLSKQSRDIFDFSQTVKIKVILYIV